MVCKDHSETASMHQADTTLLDHLAEGLAVGAVVVMHSDSVQLCGPPGFGLQELLHLARLSVVGAVVREEEKLSAKVIGGPVVISILIVDGQSGECDSGVLGHNHDDVV